MNTCHLNKLLRWILAITIGVLGLLPPNAVAESSLIFPGAQGFGINSPAGRGGTVIKVTNLNPNGPGSFRQALETQGPRIIVFEVGGVIDLQKETLRITEPFVTIAGQTAPTPGITLIRGGLEIRTHDILMKHIRFRMGDAGVPKGTKFEPDVSLYGSQAYNIVIDHCSFAWGVDENLSASGRILDPAGTSNRITFSNNFIAEGLYNSVHQKGIHSMGTLIFDRSTDIAVIGNYYAHNNERNPWFKGSTTGVIVNNLIYNPGVWAIRLGFIPKEWKDSPVAPENTKVSIIGNYMMYGVNTPAGLGLVGTNNANGEAYMEDNLAFDSNNKSVPLVFGGIKLLERKPSWPGGLQTLPAAKVVDQVLSHAGARPRDRDFVDQRLVDDFLKRQGKFVNSQEEVGGYPMAKMTYRDLQVPSENIDQWLHSFSLKLE